jgi:hypothetical protein
LRELLTDLGAAGAPKNSSEWRLMNITAKRAAEHLGIPVSELQATLWYTTQKIYRMLGAKADSSSYLDAAHAILKKFGKARR